MTTTTTKSVLFLAAQLCVGGSEKKAINLANCLRKKGYKTAFAFFKGDSTLTKFLDDDVTTFTAGQQGKFDISAMLRYRKFVLSQGIQCVVSMGLYAAALHKICLLGASNRPQEFVSLNMSVPTPKVKQRLPLYKLLMGKAHIIFGATYQQQVWEEEYGFTPSTSEVIYNGVDSDHFSTAFCPEFSIKDKLPIDKGDIVVGVVAALRPEKAIGDLISAAKTLREQGLPLKVLVVGDGSERSNLEQKTRKEKMQDNVFFLGRMSDVRPALCAMDIFALPSVAVETFSNAALEAMAMEVPVVLSDIGGAREMVSEGLNGFLFPPGDIDRLALGIKKMLTKNNIKTMGRAARTIVKDRFAQNNMVADYQKIIDSI